MPMTENITALRVAGYRMIFSAPDDFFFARRNNFSGAVAQNILRAAARITCRVFSGLTVFLLFTAFFSAEAADGEKFQPAEMIICPVIDLAKTGSMLDEYYLARAYDKGYCGIIKNKKSAEAWYLKAAKQGHTLAQYQLGEMYFTGEGAAADYPEAKRWYLAAARQGHGLSQLRLGFLYAEGHFKGLQTDYAEAEKWFLKAAENNAGDARFRLGNFYHNYKRPPDLKNALLWLRRAAEGGHRVAMFDLARLLTNKAEALVWMKKAAELDVLQAQIALRSIYALGDGVPKDPAQSFFWTLKIAGRPNANPFWLNKAGDVFFDGWGGVSKDYPQAIRFYERAAAKKDPHALARLGRIYTEGLGVAADPVKGAEYIKKSESVQKRRP